MISARGLRVSALSLVALACPLSARASLLPFPIKVETFANGLRLVMVQYPSPGLISYNTLVRVGSRDEVEKGVTGFAHFFEHMMFRGTELHPPEVVDAYLKKTGADQNGFTTDDFTCYTFFGRSDHLEELVKMEADRFANLRYTEDVFKTESKAVLGEYNKSASSPSLPLEERLREIVFKQHTYGHTTLGYLRDIEDMPNQFEYSTRFLTRFYTPDNALIIAVGDFEPSILTGYVRKHYSGWKIKRVTTRTAVEPPQKKEVRAHVEWKTPTLPMLSMSWRTPATRYDSKETAVYNILYELLFGRASALYAELVLEKQLVDSFEDWSWNHRDPYLFHVVAKVKDPAQIGAVELRVEKGIGAVARGKVDQRLLEDVKSNVRYSLLLSMETPDKIATTLGYYIAPTGEVDGLERLLKAIQKVSVGDVQRFAERYLVHTNRSIVTLAAKEEKK